MSLTPAAAVAWLRSPVGRRAIRYSMVSVVSIAVSQVVLFLTFGVGRLGSAVECNVIATAVATIPSYELNRKWAWGRTGSSHFLREVVPFWAAAFVGLALSLLAVGIAQHASRDAGLSHLTTSLVVNASSLFAYGVLWVGKFLFFNLWLFSDRNQVTRPTEEEPVAVLD
jgi:putative flippase GtrA